MGDSLVGHILSLCQLNEKNLSPGISSVSFRPRLQKSLVYRKVKSKSRKISLFVNWELIY